MNDDIKEKYLKFKFKLVDDTDLVLTYELYPNSIRNKWINHFKKRKKEKNTHIHFTISNKNSKDLDDLTKKLNSLVEDINLFYDRKLPRLKDSSQVDKNLLNFLHSEFELYGERCQKIIIEGNYYGNLQADVDPNVWPGTNFNIKFHETWINLNECIHIIETALEITANDFPRFHCLTNIYPPVIGEPLTETDKLFLEYNFDWGDLYLGYNTLGKDYMHAFHDNDIRVIENNQIRVQEYFSTELWLNFSKNFDNQGKKRANFYRWYKSLNSDLQKKIPIANLNKLALGRYYIGRIVIDETFLNFCDKKELWTYDIDIKKQWNLEVFSKIDYIENITLHE